ncbi:MAG TPA: type II toxin-antitoxin system VapC family toxin [Thermoanaerobaculia bacterium]|nr:type II toxin-antitoxin system VapC family toxin [Thermoanaerobaculia bacterium]
MVKRVLDTSVVVKWFFAEEGSDRAEIFLRELEEEVASAIVPISLYYEFCNVLWVKRRKGLDEAAASAIWQELIRLPLEVVDGIGLLPQALAFSFRHEVSPYDAAFVVLAQEQECDFITADDVLWLKLRGAHRWVRRL